MEHFQVVSLCRAGLASGGLVIVAWSGPSIAVATDGPNLVVLL
jgi:hypothetical protein